MLTELPALITEPLASEHDVMAAATPQGLLSLITGPNDTLVCVMHVVSGKRNPNVVY